MSEEKHPPGSIHPMPLYAVPIHTAIVGGNLAEMKNLLAEAKTQLTTQGDLSAAVNSLQLEIAKLEADKQLMPEEHKPPIFLYAVPIHQAIATGDLIEMKRLAAEAEQHLAAQGNLSAALDSLKLEIAKRETATQFMPEERAAPVPPYGLPIHRAIVKGNLAEMKRLAAETETQLAAQGDLSAALDALKLEIAKKESRR